MKKLLPFCLTLIFSISLLCSCAGTAASAEEYYALGMAFFDLGNFTEAERWLTRARQSNRTMTASQYNLGRIAFETQRYEEAARHFENILRRDPNNVLALRAAAYTRIKTGDLELAEKHYTRLLELVPESLDYGYNHALVLYAMGYFNRAEEVLQRYPSALSDNWDTILLHARILSAQNRVEAIDIYSKWLNNNSGNHVRYEYALLLERHDFFARALGELRSVLNESTEDTGAVPKKSDVRFSLARVLLIAESASNAGITELQAAVNEGFNDINAVRDLLNSGRISAANKASLGTIIENMQNAIDTAAQQQTVQENELEHNP